MTGDRSIPRPGEYYRHFKGNLYEIVTVAVHSETEEKLVIYRALYGSYRDYARPLEMFLSLVDRQKYPESKQTYRFEKVGDCIHGLDAAEEESPEIRETAAGDSIPKEPLKERDCGGIKSENQVLIAFLNAEGLEEKISIIRENRLSIGQSFVDGAAIALDMVVEEGEVDDRLRELVRKLQLMARYEGRKLR